MKFIIIGNSKLTIELSKAILLNNFKILSIVSSKRKFRPNNSYNLKKFANKNKISYYETENINNRKTLNYIKKNNCDFIISTWHQIIKKELLGIPNYYIIGTHPTDLTINRGRHPLHWLINMKIKLSYFSFFKMTEGIDDGPIFYKRKFKISDNINISNENMNISAKNGINYILKKLSLKNYKNINNLNHNSKSSANYFRKRNFHDIILDPRMNYDSALSIVNSFLLPNYPGARLYYDKLKYIIIHSITKIQKTKKNLYKYEIGCVVRRTKNKIIIRFCDFFVELKCNNIEKNFPKKIFPPSYYFDN